MKNNFALFLVVGAVIFAGCIGQPTEVTEPNATQQPEQSTPTPTETQTQTQPDSGQLTGTVPQPTQTAAVKEFTVRGSSFKFTPNSITVNKGDTIKITFISDDITHDLCVGDAPNSYGCTKIVSNGGSDTLQFIAKETANLKFYCSVDGHRQFGMQGDFKIQ